MKKLTMIGFQPGGGGLPEPEHYSGAGLEPAL